MEEEKIVLDRKSFEALAVDTRVRILKALRQRRKTLTEISGELGLAVSGVKEHLETLQNAELITRVDDGHKWKYYELTKKGSEIISPKELRVWVLLSLSAVALILSSLMLIMPAGMPLSGNTGTGTPEPGTYAAGQQLMAAAKAGSECQGNASATECGAAGDARALQANGSQLPAPMLAADPGGTAQDGMAENQSQGPGAQNPAPAPLLAVAAVSAVTLLACIAMLALNRIRAGQA